MLDNLFFFSGVVETYVKRESDIDFVFGYILPILDIILKCGLIYALILLVIALRIYIRKNSPKWKSKNKKIPSRADDWGFSLIFRRI